MEEEIWRKVPGWENYEISITQKEGKCRRVFKHIIKEKTNTRTHNGYIVWQFSKNGKVLTHQAAKWIALTFPEMVQNEYFEGAEIDHIDTNTLNNHPSNLRWVDRVGQMNNPLTKEHMSECQLGVNINNPQLSKKVIQYNVNGEFICDYPSTMEAERQTGIHHSGISMCCLGKRDYAGNGKELFIWKYERETV